MNPEENYGAGADYANALLEINTWARDEESGSLMIESAAWAMRNFHYQN